MKMNRHLGMGGHEGRCSSNPVIPGMRTIEDQTVRLSRPIRAQEFLGRSKYVHYEIDGPEQRPK